MKRYYCLLLSVLLFSSCAKDSDSVYEPLPNLQERLMAGGETTVFLTSSNAFSTPAANLSGGKLDFHLDGDFQFETVFVTAPAPVNGGVGPIFNNSSCVSCHPKDGRSAFPTDINSLSGFFLRTSMPGVGNNNAPIPVPGFGDQIQNQAIFGFEPEAKFKVDYTPIVETLADGTQVTLQKPNYSLIDTYIPFPQSAQLSPRLASPVFGLGLLEAIPEYYILNNEDVNDA
ncbi:MAG TPA: di-heme oxidoredictase family protein, partial [Aequorivita sp.]|nr:di-heme oxidoredictase family protein [Aequorivita sp.]